MRTKTKADLKKMVDELLKTYSTIITIKMHPDRFGKDFPVDKPAFIIADDKDEIPVICDDRVGKRIIFCVLDVKVKRYITKKYS